MFKDEYNLALENITPDSELKQNILKKIELNKQKQSQKSTIKFTRAAVAVAAVFAIVLSVWSINKNGTLSDIFSTKSTPETAQNMTYANSYNEIYKKLKSLSKKDNFILYEYAIEDSAAKGADVAENTTAATSAKGNENGYYDVGAEERAETATDDYSTTNTQVENVDEADIVKTDGKYIYILKRQKNSYSSVSVTVVKAGKNPVQVAKIPVSTDAFKPGDEMYLYKDKLVVLGSCYDNTVNKDLCVAVVYDISAPENIKKLFELKQSGQYNTSRMIDDKLYLISNYTLFSDDLNKYDTNSFVPQVTAKNFEGGLSYDCIVMNESCTNSSYTVISGYNISTGELIENNSILGGTDHLYCSTNNIITADYNSDGYSFINRFEIKDGTVKYKAEGKVEGYLHNQFSIDEHNGYFRFVTTSNTYNETENAKVFSSTTYNHLFVLDESLKQVSAIKDLAPGENVKSARFMGDIAYFVTFRDIDPLFSVDLSNPKNPKIIGQLKIPGFSDYLFPFGEGILLGFGREQNNNTSVVNLKLSLFNISDPSNVSESAKLITKGQYSSSSYDHKATFVDKKRQLVGFFEEYYYTSPGKYLGSYVLYKYENGAFTEKLNLPLNNAVSFNLARGLYIGEEFYVVSYSQIDVIDLNTFEIISSLELS